MSSISLEFISPLPLYDTVKPYGFNVVLNGIPEEAQSNIQTTQYHNIPLFDARSNALDSFSYEKQGFRFLTHAASSTYLFSLEPEFLSKYCEQMVDFIRGEFGAEHVICYDLRVRHSQTQSEDYKNRDDLTRANLAPAVYSVHIDHTKSSGFDRIRRHLTSTEADIYLSDNYRARIVNVWRPLYRPIEACPLAYCDARTISEDDVLAADRVSPDYVFDLYYAKYSPRQKWYWLSDQTPDEMTVFVQFDSSAAGKPEVVQACPHAAFHNPLAGKNPPPRESVEVRFMVFNKGSSQAV